MTFEIIANWREKLNLHAELQKKQEMVVGEIIFETDRNKLFRLVDSEQCMTMKWLP
jgi:hypothetical protein